jgi:hypothetical protein
MFINAIAVSFSKKFYSQMKFRLPIPCIAPIAILNSRAAIILGSSAFWFLRDRIPYIKT